MSLTEDCENLFAVNLYEKFNFIKGWERITHVWQQD